MPLNVSMRDYKKSILVEGDTRPIREKLKKLGGRWCRPLAAWVFPECQRSQISAMLDSLSEDVSQDARPEPYRFARQGGDVSEGLQGQSKEFVKKRRKQGPGGVDFADAPFSEVQIFSSFV